SKWRAALRETGFCSAPTAIGISGQRSRTSNTMGICSRRFARTPGIAIVRGVLEARTISPPRVVARRALTCANLAKDLERRTNDIALSYFTGYQWTVIPSISSPRQPAAALLLALSLVMRLTS